MRKKNISFLISIMFFAYPLLAQDISGAFKDIGSELKNSLNNIKDTVLDAIDKNVTPVLQDTAKKAENAIAPVLQDVLRDVEKKSKDAKDALNNEKPSNQPPVKEYRVAIKTYQSFVFKSYSL